MRNKRSKTILLCAVALFAILSPTIAPTRAQNVYAAVVSVSELRDSTVYGTWDNSYSNYNCYSYAINQTDKAHNPGYKSDDPFLNRKRTVQDTTISEIATWTKNDLKKSNYPCVKITLTRPNYPIPGRYAICVRKCSSDYHYMRLSENSWYHKPGNSAILKYNYLPSNDRVWIAEGSWPSGLKRDFGITYDSEIYYLIYQQTHSAFSNITYSIGSGNTHLACLGCGDGHTGHIMGYGGRFGYTDYGHTLTCNECDYERNEGHLLKGSGSTLSCACGYSVRNTGRPIELYSSLAADEMWER